MASKFDIIERARIMYEVIYELDSTALGLDMLHNMTYEECIVVHNHIQATYELMFGESAQAC